MVSVMTAYDPAALGMALFQEVGDALFLLDPDTDELIDVNPVALRLTGFSRPELLKLAATYLFRLEPGGGLQKLRGAFAKTMLFHNQDGYLLRSKEDGVWLPVNLTVSRLHVSPRPLALIIARDDRERRAAFQQVRRVEAELRAVLLSSPSALWSAERAAGPDVMLGWNYRYVSPQLARLCGRPPEFLDHPLRWADTVHSGDREAYRAAVRRLLTSSATEFEQEYRLVSPDGTVRWVRDRMHIVRDDTGRPIRIDGSVTDLTAAHTAEEALRQSERRFRALVEKSRDGILLLGETATILYASPSVRSISGYDPIDLIGHSVYDFVPEADQKRARDLIAYALKYPGEDVPYSGQALKADGSLQMVEVNACNRLDDPSVRALVVNYRDVTERDRAAMDLARQHALLNGLFTSLPDVICYKDAELRFLGCNPAFARLAGRPESEIIGQHCGAVFHADWAERIRELELKVMLSGRTMQCQDWVDYPDGRRVLLDVVLSPLHQGTDPDLGVGPVPNEGAGRVTTQGVGTVKNQGADARRSPLRSGESGLILVGRDRTEQHLLEEQLRQAQKMDAVGQLAGGIAHDFNNLLTVILGNLELLRSGAEGCDPSELVESSERAARQAADLTRQLLGFARRQPLRRTAVDLGALVREAVGLLSRTIDPRVRVSCLAPDNLPLVSADPVQVQQVVMNLCLNARDAMPDGGTLVLESSYAAALPAEAPVAESRQGGFIRLSVRDSGMGMTEEVSRRIFEPFFTTKAAGKGTGLGLAVVYGIVNQHGGWVGCHSQPGVGTTFDVYLPCGPLFEQVHAELDEPDPYAVPAGRGETILVADDEPGILEIARLTLANHGYRVVAAEDGGAAVAAFSREPDQVQLVVLDGTMPVLSGPQAFEAIRGISPNVPVLFVSGDLSGQQYVNSTDRVYFLAKPYTPTDLAVAIRTCLDAG